MARQSKYNQDDWAVQSSSSTQQIDAGLRSYMLSVYNYMGLGLTLTGITAWLTYQMAVVESSGEVLGLTPFGAAIYNSPLQYVIMFAPLVMVLFVGSRMANMSVQGATITFGGFAVLMGLSLSSIFLVFTKGSITQVFFITASMFGALSIYGYTTKADLSGVGSMLIMGVWGLIAASVVNMFMASPMLSYVISYAGVLLFAGLTVYDTQQIKNMYFQVAGDAVVAKRAAIMGALKLYLDFINLFIMLLRIFGDRR